MINVDKMYSDSSYIERYWINNLNIDKSKTKINENRDLDLEDSIKKEKFNKKITNRKSYNINHTEENYDNFKYTNIIRSNITREGYNSNQYKYTGNTNKQKSSENKREKHNLSEKCRIYEYNQRERKILLDSFSKPKLLNNN